MKADEPPTRVVKYGMAASEQHRLVERHFAVMHDQKAISAAHIAHALQVGPSLRVAMERIAQRLEAVAPIPAPTAKLPREVALAGLRERLGIG